jgi:hypothetical protein
MLASNPVIRGTATESKITVAKDGSLFIASFLPPLAPLVASGAVFAAKEASTTTCATAPPTTTAGLTMQNPQGSGKIYVVLAVFGENDVNAASEESFGIMHCVHKNAAAALTRDITVIAGYLAGGGVYPGSVVLDAGATVVDDGWTVVGNSAAENSKASAAWGQLFVPLMIPVVVKPGGSYSLEAVSTSATTEVALGIVWAEIDAAAL